MGVLGTRVLSVHLGDVRRVEYGREGPDRAQVGADPLDRLLVEDPGPAGGDEGVVGERVPHAQKSSWGRETRGTRSSIRMTRCSSRRPRRTVPSWDSAPIGWPEPALMDSTPAISVVPTAPSPTQSTASRPSAGGRSGAGSGGEPSGTCSLDDMGYTRSLGAWDWDLRRQARAIRACPSRCSGQATDDTDDPKQNGGSSHATSMVEPLTVVHPLLVAPGVDGCAQARPRSRTASATRAIPTM